MTPSFIPSEYLLITRGIQSPSKKTMTLIISAKSTGDYLGVIKWYGAWRRYCFYPANMTVFSSGCLKDIQNCLDKLMNERKTKCETKN